MAGLQGRDGDAELLVPPCRASVSSACAVPRAVGAADLEGPPGTVWMTTPPGSSIHQCSGPATPSALRARPGGLRPGPLPTPAVPLRGGAAGLTDREV